MVRSVPRRSIRPVFQNMRLYYAVCNLQYDFAKASTWVQYLRDLERLQSLRIYPPNQPGAGPPSQAQATPDSGVPSADGTGPHSSSQRDTFPGILPGV